MMYFDIKLLPWMTYFLARYENKIEKEETISALRRPIYLLLEKVKEKEKTETNPWQDEDPLSSSNVIKLAHLMYLLPYRL